MNPCRKCKVDLVVGENWDESRKRKRDYICRPCMRIKTKESRASVINPMMITSRRQKAIPDSIEESFTNMQSERAAIAARIEPIEAAYNTQLEKIRKRCQEAANRAKLDREAVEKEYCKQVIPALDRMEKLDAWLRAFAGAAKAPSLETIRKTIKTYLRGNPDAPECVGPRLIGDRVAHLIGEKPGEDFANRALAAMRSDPYRFLFDSKTNTFSLREEVESEEVEDNEYIDS